MKIKIILLLLISPSILYFGCKKEGNPPTTNPTPTKISRTKNQIIDSIRNEIVLKGFVIMSQDVQSDSSKVTFSVESVKNAPDQFAVFLPGTFGFNTFSDYYVGNFLQTIPLLIDSKFSSPGYAPGAFVQQKIKIDGGNGNNLGGFYSK